PGSQRPSAVGEGRQSTHLPGRPTGTERDRRLDRHAETGMGASAGPPCRLSRRKPRRFLRQEQAMTAKPNTHGSFTVTRTFDATPARVFQAFANEKAKQLWFASLGSWTLLEKKFDFRVGGHERLNVRWDAAPSSQGPDDCHSGGTVSTFDAYYHD